MTTDTDYAAYLRWWVNEGSGMPPLAKEDAEEHVRRVTQAAWMSAVHCARAALEQPEPAAPTDEELQLMAVEFARAVLQRWGATTTEEDHASL